MHIKSFLFGVLLAVIVKKAVAKIAPKDNKCYEAKTCIHNAREKCGEDENGNVRRFFDTCDIKEYNCLRGTDYVKTDMEKCKSLPPIEEGGETVRPNKPTEADTTNEKVIHVDGESQEVEQDDESNKSS